MPGSTIESALDKCVDEQVLSGSWDTVLRLKWLRNSINTNQHDDDTVVLLIQSEKNAWEAVWMKWNDTEKKSSVA